MKKILIAEDDEKLRKIIEITLMNEGFTLLFAANGAQAVEIADTENPDAIITRTRLPEISGPEIIERLKSKGNTAAIPIILLSSTEEEMDMQKNLGSSVRVNLMTPFSPMKLLAHLDLALREKTDE
jgi:DNA-binding response OmpR family regulator